MEMITDKYLVFVIEKMKMLETALFSDYSSAPLKFPNSIVHIVKVDKDGYVWFSLPKPYKDLSGLSQQFYAQLQFYHKYFDYYVTIQGKAAITDENHVSYLMEEREQTGGPNNVYIQFRIESAKYVSSEKNKTSVLECVHNVFVQLFSPNIIERRLQLVF